MTTLVMLSLVLAGVLAYIKIPVTDLPPITHPCIGIHTEYQGADPETVLNQITIPLEEHLALVKGVQEISSHSGKGHSSITLTFDISKDINQAVIDVQTAINLAEYSLPIDLEHRPTYFVQERENEPIIYLIATSLEADNGMLRQIAEKYVLPRLKRIEGIAKVDAYGESKTIYMRINPELMAARGITFPQVIDAVKRSTGYAALGGIDTGHGLLAIEMAQTIAAASDLNTIRIGDGAVLFQDIGTISEEQLFPQEDRLVSHESSANAVIISIQKTSDANTVAISRDVQSTLTTIQKELPKNISLSIWFDKAMWINASLVDVEWSLGIAFILVILVIYVSLKRGMNSLITSISLPFSLFGTLAIMYCAGFSLNLLSLVALTLSCGFVVDDAIVVLENIVRYREQGKSKREASILGTEHICFTIVSITLSLVAAFIPLLFMPGMEGRLFREFSMTLAIAITVSGIVSITIIPMLSSRFVQASCTATKNTSIFKTAYAKSLRLVLGYPKSVLFCALMCLFASISLFTRLPVNLFPEEDRGYFFAFVSVPSATSQKHILERQGSIEKIFRQQPSIDNFLTFAVPGQIVFVVKLHTKETNRPPQKDIIASLEKQLQAIPGVIATFAPWRLITVGMNFDHPGHYSLIVKGTENEAVEAAARAIEAHIKKMPEVTFVSASSNEGMPLLRVLVDEKKAHMYGIDRHDIQTLLHNAFGQTRVGFIQKGPFREEIAIELLPEYQKRLDAPSKLMCSSRLGTLVPFSAFCTVEEKLGPASLHRHEGLPSTNVYFSLADSVPINVGLKSVARAAASLVPSDTISANLSGSAQTISTTTRNTLLLLLVATIVMYTILGILYESFSHPLTILSSIPLAGLGGILTLFITHEPLSIFSAVGFLLLIGIVKKNGIMMVDYALEIQKTVTSPEEAIIEASLIRLRPIMMTTVAAIIGALPLAFGIGESAEMLRGLGLVIVGGLLFSQVLTLYVTPVLYVSLSKGKSFPKKTCGE